jgi:alpha-D-ribose 1-methylphosphonate 5-phosphate C-P lyase
MNNNEQTKKQKSDASFKITRRNLKKWSIPSFDTPFGPMWLNKPYGWRPFYLKQKQ